MDTLLIRTENFLRKTAEIRGGETVLAAFSGGADSLALLVLLRELSGKLGIRVAAGHVHHMIRGESADRDAEFCRRFSEEHGIPFYFRKVDVPAYRAAEGLTEEEAARILRYRALEEMRAEANADRIAVAHHREDQAETFLFQLIRGSGLKGLSAMQPVNGRIIRPLLQEPRSELIAFLRERGLSWCEDETNALDTGSRAKIRHHVVPALLSVREDAVANLTRTAEYLGSLDRWLREEAERWLLAHAACTEHTVTLPAKELPDAVPLQEYVVRLGIEKCGAGLKDVTRQHVADVLSLLDKQVGKRIGLPGGAAAERSYDGIVLTGPEAPEDAPAVLPKVTFRIFPNKTGLSFPEKEYTKCFDYDKISGSLSVRFREEGDLFSTRAGTEKKLKDCFIDAKIPRAMRDRIPLIADGKTVLWAVGFRMNENYKVTEKTGQVLEITVKGAENAG